MEKERTILIMRHAKSSWDDSSLRDFDRPLNKRGRRDAPAMGLYISGLSLTPDYIFCSAAKRVRETVELFSGTAGIDEVAIHFDESLYYESGEAYLDAIKSTPDKARIVMVAGHNPTIEQVVAKLSGGNVRRKITTANIACFYTSSAEWEDVSERNTTFKWLTGPKDIT